MTERRRSARPMLGGLASPHREKILTVMHLKRGVLGPITMSQYERFQNIQEQLAKEGIKLPLPTGDKLAEPQRGVLKAPHAIA